jgi:hypothetical protein
VPARDINKRQLISERVKATKPSCLSLQADKPDPKTKVSPVRDSLLQKSPLAGMTQVRFKDEENSSPLTHKELRWRKFERKIRVVRKKYQELYSELQKIQAHEK